MLVHEVSCRQAGQAGRAGRQVVHAVFVSSSSGSGSSSGGCTWCDKCASRTGTAWARDGAGGPGKFSDSENSHISVTGERDARAGSRSAGASGFGGWVSSSSILYSTRRSWCSIEPDSDLTASRPGRPGNRRALRIRSRLVEGVEERRPSLTNRGHASMWPWEASLVQRQTRNRVCFRRSSVSTFDTRERESSSLKEGSKGGAA